MIKKTALEDFLVSRYSKPICCMKLKDNDEVVSVYLNTYNDIFVVSSDCYFVWFDLDEVPVSGIRSSGVKAIKLKDSVVVSSGSFDRNLEYSFQYLLLIILLKELDYQSLKKLLGLEEEFFF